MVYAGPMTLIVVLVFGGALVLGLVIIAGAMSSRTSTTRSRVCQQCKTTNPGHARFCSHCGRRLPGA